MLNLGVAIRDITPSVPGYLSGFAHRKSPWESIHTPIYLRAFVFEGSSTDSRAAVVTADILGWESFEIELIEAELERDYGISTVIFNATHTHSAPCVVRTESRPFAERDTHYVTALYTNVRSAIAEAVDSMEEVSLSASHGLTQGLFVNRRLPTPGGMKTEPNPNGPVDEEVTLWRFDRSDGTPKAFWIHAACHPTILNGYAISAEFPGEAVAHLEALYPTATAAFLQGCSGDIRVNIIDENNRFKGTDQTDLECFSASLCETIEIISKNDGEDLGDESLSGVKVRFDQASSDRLLSDMPPKMVPLRLSALRLTKRAGMVAICGEPSISYQQYIKSLDGLSLLPLGYSNGAPGYLPTKEQILEGGYEGSDSCKFTGLPGPFHLDLEENLLKGIIQMVDDLFGPSESVR